MASRFLRMQPGMECCGVSLVGHGEQLERKGFWRSDSERRLKVVEEVIVRGKNKRAPAFVPCEAAFGNCRTLHVTKFNYRRRCLCTCQRQDQPGQPQQGETDSCQYQRTIFEAPYHWPRLFT